MSKREPVVTTSYVCKRCGHTVYIPHVEIQIGSDGKALAIKDVETYECANCAQRVALNGTEVFELVEQSPKLAVPGAPVGRTAHVISSTSVEERLGRNAPINRRIANPHIRGDVD